MSLMKRSGLNSGSVAAASLADIAHRTGGAIALKRFKHHFARFSIVIDDQDPEAIESRHIGGTVLSNRRCSPAFAHRGR